MTPEQTAALVVRWVRLYTRGLAAPIAERRVAEIIADLDDHITDERARGTTGRHLSAAIASRTVRGVRDDLSWREDQAEKVRDRAPSTGGHMPTNKTAYRAGVVLALGTTLLLVWGVAAMGVIGAEGDPFDRLYIAVAVVGLVGAVVARFEPRGMVRVLLAMAAAQGLITAIALIVGKQEVPVSSVAEIVGLNGFFAALFLTSAWLFARAARRQPPKRADLAG